MARQAILAHRNCGGPWAGPLPACSTNPRPRRLRALSKLLISNQPPPWRRAGTEQSPHCNLRSSKYAIRNPCVGVHPPGQCGALGNPLSNPKHSTAARFSARLRPAEETLVGAPGDTLASALLIAINGFCNTPWGPHNSAQAKRKYSNPSMPWIAAHALLRTARCRRLDAQAKIPYGPRAPSRKISSAAARNATTLTV